MAKTGVDKTKEDSVKRGKREVKQQVVEYHELPKKNGRRQVLTLDLFKVSAELLPVPI
jgi:hypothetical protein